MAEYSLLIRGVKYSFTKADTENRVKMMLDFTKLRSEAGGHRGAFEGLICQLGRRNPPNEAHQFVTIDGSGGDGGLEAYWIAKDESEQGYQAKFHLKSGDVDWTKIDSSVSAALQSHPKMSRMVIAIACDLTDTVPNRRGRSGRDQWNGHRLKWIALAASQDRAVEFELWDASTIENLLLDPRSRGLRDYWLGEIEITHEWFRRAFKRTEAMLEERYNPDDHVEVAAESLLGGLSRDDRFLSELRRLLKNVEESVPRIRPDLHPEVLRSIRDLSALAREMAEYRPAALSNPIEDFPMQGYMQHIKKVDIAASKMSNAITKWKPKGDDDRQREYTDHSYEVVESAVWDVHEACEKLSEFFRGDACKADRARFALFTGRAGAGKSHLLGAEVDRITACGFPGLLLLGTSFSETRSLSILLSQSELGAGGPRFKALIPTE